MGRLYCLWAQFSRETKREREKRESYSLGNHRYLFYSLNASQTWQLAWHHHKRKRRTRRVAVKSWTLEVPRGRYLDQATREAEPMREGYRLVS